MEHGLITLKAVIAELKLPIHRLKVIHIAGTNGKGTCGFVLNKLLSTTTKTGWFHSPALYENHDILVDSKPLDSDYLSSIQSSLGNRILELSFFELRVLLAIAVFCDLAVDYCIIECGMGGKYDATNVFDVKEMAIITKIGLDHQSVLGDTIQEIAAHKLAICKGSKYALTTSNQHPSVIAMLDEYNQNFILCEPATIDSKSRYQYTWKYKDILLPTKILGDHQSVNIALAIEATIYLSYSKYDYTSLTNSNWLGRLTYCTIGKYNLLLDGAHNTDSIIMLNSYLQKHVTESIAILFATTGNKNAEELIDLLMRHRNDTLYLADFEPSLLAPWVTKTPTINYGRYANEKGNQLTDLDPSQLILVCGSLYLIQDVIKRMVITDY